MGSKICYYALYNPNSLQGVHKKIESTILGFRSKGFNSYQYGIDKDSKPSFAKMLVRIIQSDDEIILIRSIVHLNIFIIPSLIIAKLKGTTIIFDIPTPFKSAIFEIIKLKEFFFLKIFKIISTLIGSFFVMLISDLLLFYGNDFKFYNKYFSYKIKLVSNFLTDNKLGFRKKNQIEVKDKLNLIAVGNFSFSQGFDLILEAMYIWNNNNLNKYKIYLNLVGTGEFEYYLKQLTDKYKLTKYVNFHGYLKFDEYKILYHDAHLAIGSIASFRKKLTHHSPLKEREYTLVGIPFLSSGIDIGFSKECKFRYIIREDFLIDDILSIFSNININLTCKTETITNYALNNLTFDTFYNSLYPFFIKNKLF